jgi:hypothetical protein
LKRPVTVRHLSRQAALESAMELLKILVVMNETGFACNVGTGSWLNLCLEDRLNNTEIFFILLQDFVINLIMQFLWRKQWKKGY